MKARTKIEKQVAASNEKLTVLIPKVITWAVRKVAGHVCFRTSAHKCTCGDCGRHFDHKGKGKSVCCPHCGTRLQIKDTLKRTIKEAYYFWKRQVSLLPSLRYSLTDKGHPQTHHQGNLLLFFPRSNRPFAGATGLPFGNDLPQRNAYGGRLLGGMPSVAQCRRQVGCNGKSKDI